MSDETNHDLMRAIRSLTDKIDANNRDTAAIKRWCIGDPDNPEAPGILTRLDRIEQRGKIWAWINGTVLGAVIAYVANWVLAKFQGKP